MPLDVEKLILEIHTNVAEQGTDLKRLIHKLEGNGQPGLFREFDRVKAAHEACVKQRADEQATKDRRAALIAGLISSIIGAVCAFFAR